MARRVRDYRAEYARQKQLAAESGYGSARRYKQARRDLGIPRRASPVPARILSQNTDRDPRETARLWRMRREAKEWSDAHSRKRTSRYLSSFTDKDVEEYHAAFVDKRGGKDGTRERLKRVHDFMVPRYLSQREWDARPSTVPLRP